MHQSISPDRRSFLALTGAAALFPAHSFAQALPMGPSAVQRLATLAGFEVLPRDLVEGLRTALGNDTEAASALESEDPLPDDIRARLLTTLYTGVTSGENATRIGFSSALMWAAIEETNNVISYCGGRPGFWAEPPQST